MRSRFIVVAALVGLVLASPARAGHHLWDFTEIYSNSTGSVQFIEMFTAEDNEQNMNGFTITAGANTFTFVGNLSTAATANTWIVIGTSNVGTLPGGVTPDYLLPANFFSTAGGTLNYAGGTDVWSYGAVPTNGTLSLQRNGSTAINSPENFVGDQGSLNVPPSPMLSNWAILLLIGGLLLAASGLLRRRQASTA